MSHRPDELDLLASVTGSRRRGVDLRNGRTIVVLPNDGRPAHFDLLLTLNAPWVPRPEPLSLLLEIPSSVQPEWNPDAKPAPPPAKVEFQVRDRSRLQTVTRVFDGTGGLRRSGIVRLWLADWRPETDGSYLVRIRTSAATYTAPIRLSRVIVNAVLARHRTRHRHVVTASAVGTGRIGQKLPNSTLELQAGGGTPLSGHVRVRIRETDRGSWMPWREVQDLTPESADARVFVLDKSVIRFGDGRVGRQPVVARNGEVVRVNFWAGGGEEGNIRAGCRFEHRSFVVTNPVAGVGGRVDESLQDARARAATAMKRLKRTVTVRDFEVRAEATPGVSIGRAVAVPGLDETRPFGLRVPGLTTVYVIPSAFRGEVPTERVEPVHVPSPMPDPGALAAVRAHLESARLLGSVVEVRPPRWRDVRLRLLIRSRVAQLPGLDGRLHRAMETYLDALVGDDEGGGWPLGGALDPSALMRRAQRELTEGAIVDEVAIEVACGQAETCRPVEIGHCHLPRLLATAVDVRPLEGSERLK